MQTQTIITQLRDRARAYETGSPQREAYQIAQIRYEYAELDERIDKVIMRNWAIQAERLHNVALAIDKQATSKADAQTEA